MDHEGSTYYLLARPPHKAGYLTVVAQNAGLNGIRFERPSGFFPLSEEPHADYLTEGLQLKTEALINNNPELEIHGAHLIVSDVLLTGRGPEGDEHVLHQPGGDVSLVEAIRHTFGNFSGATLTLTGECGLVRATARKNTLTGGFNRVGVTAIEGFQLVMPAETVEYMTKIGNIRSYLVECAAHRRHMYEAHGIHLQPNAFVSGGVYTEVLLRQLMAQEQPFTIWINAAKNPDDVVRSVQNLVGGATPGVVCAIVNRPVSHSTTIGLEHRMWMPPVEIRARSFFDFSG